MAVGNRLGKAEGRVGPRLCAGPAPCQTVTTTEVRIMPSGAEERSGHEMRPLCGPCPNRESRAVLHVEVRLDYRNRHGGRDHEEATSGARVPPVGPDGDEGEHDTSASTVAPTEPDDGFAFPPSWPPDHPARLVALGLEPPDRPRGRGYNEATRIDPRDFGL